MVSDQSFSKANSHSITGLLLGIRQIFTQVPVFPYGICNTRILQPDLSLPADILAGTGVLLGRRPDVPMVPGRILPAGSTGK